MLRNLFSFSGRIGRQTFWLSIIALLVIIMVLYMIAGLVFGFPPMDPNRPPDFSHPFWKAYAVIAVGSFWPSLAISVKRLHDRNKRGWWLLLPYAFMLVPGAIMMMNPGLMMMQAPGSPTAPVPGQPPVDPTTMIVFGIAGLLSMIAMIWLLVVIGFLRGTKGPNRFGDDPLGGTSDGPPEAGHDWAS